MESQEKYDKRDMEYDTTKKRIKVDINLNNLSSSNDDYEFMSF